MSDIKQEPKKGLKAWHYIAIGAVVFIAIGSLSDKSKPSKPNIEADSQINSTTAQAEEKPIDDGCNRDITGKYVDRWAKDKDKKLIAAVINNRPVIVTDALTWATLGDEGQIMAMAIVDCTVAGPNKHLAELEAVTLKGTLIEKFDAVQLQNARELTKDIISKPPKD